LEFVVGLEDPAPNGGGCSTGHWLLGFAEDARRVECLFLSGGQHQAVGASRSVPYGRLKMDTVQISK
jgi:hypothetical protein